jgi:uncharacterized membrane protein
MPYRWTRTTSPDGWCLTLWPHRSMTPEGFAGFLGASFAMAAVPLLAVLGSPILWGLLPFALGTLALTWMFLRRSLTDRALVEELTLAPGTARLTRREPRRADRHWQANPHWIRAELHPKGGPVENYLTLAGGGRTVELGAFLTPEERAALHGELSDRLAQLRAPGHEGA